MIGIAFQEGFAEAISTGQFDDVTVTGEVLGLDLYDDFAHGAGQWSEVDLTSEQAWGPARYSVEDAANSSISIGQ